MTTSKAKIISISLPPEMHDDVLAIAEEERRSISEVFREALRRYMAQQAVGQVRKEIRKKNKKKMDEDDVERVIDEGRS